ncbi:MAG TPA: alpha/beta hydrolase [Gaiellaceae bacterium]|nr:alpha/beta hydrolase [Gaiellaceae bacterium]
MTRSTYRPRLLLVHGSVVGGEATWGAQRPLEARFELVVPTRRGFPPGPEVAAVDFEEEARWLEPLVEPGTHLVGHSYGGVICLFAAVLYPGRLRSLCVVEPPCLGVAAGDPAVDAFVARSTALWERRSDPETFLRAFLETVGAPVPSGRFSPALLQGARTLMVERYPWEAEIPFEALRATAFPKLVVSGAHSAAFEAVCDVLQRELPAERAVLPGAGHSVQRLGEPFNELLAAFVDRAEAAAPPVTKS